MALTDILLIGPSTLARELTHAVAVADRVLHWPAFSSIPVVISKSHSEDGAYHHRVKPGRPLKIAISQNAHHAALTLLHEAGHFLDHQMLNPIKRGFASEHDPSFEELWALWRESSVLQNLERIRSRKRPYLAPEIHRLVSYHLRPREVWARTFVQWTVSRSNDPLLESQFRKESAHHVILEETRSFIYWEPAEFDRIMDAVGRLFHTAGLR